MAFSQNVVFRSAVAPDEHYPTPLGVQVAREIADVLNKNGWPAGNAENWRDVGWLVAIKREDSELEVVLSSIGDDEWLLQVGPARGFGILARLLGRSPSANREDCYAVARIIHDGLSRHPRYDDFKWRWDAFPDGERATYEPQPPGQRRG